MNDRLILIVEDDETHAELLTKILESHGYITQWTQSGNQALKMIEKSMPALIVLDVIIPIMLGSELLLKIKSEPKTKNIPVLIISALTSLKDVEKHLRMGAAGYINKPYDEKRVIDKVSRSSNVFGKYQCESKSLGALKILQQLLKKHLPQKS